MKYIKLYENQGHKSILTVLEENGGELENKELAIKCGYDLSVTEIGNPVSIFTFYEKLSKLIDQKKVKESKDKKSIILVK